MLLTSLQPVAGAPTLFTPPQAIGLESGSGNTLLEPSGLTPTSMPAVPIDVIPSEILMDNLPMVAESVTKRAFMKRSRSGSVRR
ncbi:hypothetical protein H0H81_003624 [Sphagnurus paluster]|uniref:Uncharacterized protein n=1 Tax=Sphagnurus paluster TaxID=117069 RepID=A0A9P7GLE2_9AGAR|nr:hypothetical protein H0H81_003624 [Sphagnurus paluster]